ncbi:AAA family ATPase [Shewanella sp. WXL01]|uniref:ExeA family protein n=1 Tax=Shewanella sp. WXL01 TaxID=2709721 RepID=UPI00143847F4|nr:AAA family ATPase [Shewanella sp. WXL01]NKF51393.1 AAA family ATPase [Shewanella sp. WXL01]
MRREITIGEVLKRNGITSMKLLRQLNEDGCEVGRYSVRALASDNKCPRNASGTQIRRAMEKLLGNRAKEEELNTIFSDPSMKGNDLDIQKPVFGVIDFLIKHGISQSKLINALKNHGLKLSPAAMSQALRHNVWPKTVTQEEIVTAINHELSQYGSKEELSKLWDVRANGVVLPTDTAPETPSATGKPTIIFEQPEPEMLHQSTLRHFKLSRHPFENEIRTEADLFMSQQQTLLREAMVQASLGGSILAVIGECGAGKSEVRKGFLEYIHRNHPELFVIEPTVINKKRLTAEMIFDALAEELQINNLPVGLERRARKVETALKRSVKAGNKHVLVIEEGHDLSNEVLKYLKRIWELTDGFNRLISIVLIGQPELAQKLSPSNYDIREFARRCNVMTVPPLARGITDYIAHKFACCNVNYLSVIETDAIDELRSRLQAKVSYGLASRADEHQDMSYPLTVNNWLVNAMNMAANLGEPVVSADIIKELK